MPFIGNQPALAYTSFAKQDFTTSATTSYTLDNPVTNANELALFINFVRQEPTTSYTASGTALTLTSATSATDDMYCVFLGKAVQTVNPPNASVGASQLVDGAVTSSKLSSGKVLQVVQTVFTGAKSTTSTSLTDVSGASVSITPISTSNKILVLVNANDVQKSNADVYGTIALLRGSTEIAQLGGQIGFTGSTSYNNVGSVSGTYLDSPSTTSSTTFKLQFKTSGGTFYINTNSGTESMITVMEISA